MLSLLRDKAMVRLDTANFVRRKRNGPALIKPRLVAFKCQIEEKLLGKVAGFRGCGYGYADDGLTTERAAWLFNGLPAHKQEEMRHCSSSLVGWRVLRAN